jgi:hypothetical protein
MLKENEIEVSGKPVEVLWRIYPIDIINNWYIFL